MQGFDYNELLFKFRYPLLVLLLGLILAGVGVFVFKSGFTSSTKVEVLNNSTQNQGVDKITVEIAGAVINPGVYKLAPGARIEDLLTASGGLSEDADRSWTDKYLNRAARLTDGQKIFVPSANQQSNTLSANKSDYINQDREVLGVSNGELTNINTASLSELDKLPGIGQVYAQNIIDHRPYSTVEELISKGAIKQSLLDKIRDKISVY